MEDRGVAEKQRLFIDLSFCRMLEDCWVVLSLTLSTGMGPSRSRPRQLPTRGFPRTHTSSLSPCIFFFSLAMALQKLDMSLDNFAGIILKTLWLHLSPTATAAGRVVQQNRESFSWE